MKKNYRVRDCLFIHYFKETEEAEWKDEKVIATCEEEAKQKLRITPGKHDPDKVFNSAIESKPLTRTELVRLTLHSPQGSP